MKNRKRPLKIGLMLPIADGWMAGRSATWTEMKAMALHAEAVGFDSVWINDHLIFRFGAPDEPMRGTWECGSLLPALAAMTTHVEIGVIVLCTGFRNPALLAKMADAVDGISDGRLVLGLGAGYHEPEYRAFGYPYDHLVGRFDEAIRVIHPLLRTGKVDFQGQYYTARECEILPRLSPRNGPPILMGPTSNSPWMLRLMAEYADYWTAFNVSHLDSYAPMKAAVNAACEKAGRDPATLARTLTVAIDLPGCDTTSNDWVRRFRVTRPPFAGSVHAIADHLHAFADAGVSHVQVWLDPLSMQGIETFAPVLEALDQSVGG